MSTDNTLLLRSPEKNLSKVSKGGEAELQSVSKVD